MDQENDPQNNDPGKDYGKGAMAIIWLIVGLLPIPILLSLITPNGSRAPWLNPMVLLLGCATCNMVGGIGCMVGIKDWFGKIFFGILLGGFFFILSWGIVAFQACSHMNI